MLAIRQVSGVGIFTGSYGGEVSKSFCTFYQKSTPFSMASEATFTLLSFLFLLFKTSDWDLCLYEYLFILSLPFLFLNLILTRSTEAHGFNPSFYFIPQPNLTLPRGDPFCHDSHAIPNKLFTPSFQPSQGSSLCIPFNLPGVRVAQLLYSSASLLQLGPIETSFLPSIARYKK